MPESQAASHTDPLGQIVAVVGPTASGKTALADAIAHARGGEVITADSMQVYRGMDIGTAKSGPSERTVAHHCTDLVDPGAPYSAALYQRDSRWVIDDLLARGVQPILAGGSGLYVRAALDEMEFPSGDLVTPHRVELERMAEEIGAVAMHDRLAQVDPDAAALIHPNNVRRTIRALEMNSEGASYAVQAAGFSERRAHYPHILIGLRMDREPLYESVDRRVDAMIAAGLLGEVEQLIARGFRDALTAAQAIGYKELVPVLEQGADFDAAVASIKRATRRYAKRQMTWFTSDPRVRWIDVTQLSPADVASAAAELLASIRGTSN